MNHKKSTDSEMYQAGYHSVGAAIIEQAISDVKVLQQKKIIVGGKPTTKWPFAIYRYTKKGKTIKQKKPKLMVNHYRTVNDVNQLIYFLKSKYIMGIFASIGVNIDQTVMLERLGLNG